MPPMGTATHSEHEMAGNSGVSGTAAAKVHLEGKEEASHTGSLARTKEFLLRWDVLIMVFSVVRKFRTHSISRVACSGPGLSAVARLRQLCVHVALLR